MLVYTTSASFNTLLCSTMDLFREREEGVVGRVVEAASDTSIEPLPEPDFEALDSRVFFSGKNN